MASHLLATDPDENPAVVTTLRAAAAAEVLAQGAPSPAWCLACGERSKNLRPMPIGSTCSRSWAGQRVCSPSGQGVERLRQAFAAAREPQLRAGIAIELAGQLLTVGGLEETAEVCRAAIRDSRR